MFNLVLFGPPGAGKGTQAEKLIKKYGFNHISTGEVIRDQIRKGTELGLSVQSYIEKGLFAPDELVININDVRYRGGLMKIIPFLSVGYAVAGLANLGLPGFSGFVADLYNLPLLSRQMN